MEKHKKEKIGALMFGVGRERISETRGILGRIPACGRGAKH